MSAVQLPAAAPGAATAVWGAPVTSVMAYATFLACIAVALVTRNETLLVALCAAAATNATTAVQFWLGSSKSAQTHAETIERQGTMLAAMAPDPPGTGAAKPGAPP